MGIYTFLVEKSGSTIIEQFSGLALSDAVSKWYRLSETQPGSHVPEDSEPTPVSDTQNVWCLSGLDDEDVFFLVHVVGPMEEETVGLP
jgi:hypothetical protein